MQRYYSIERPIAPGTFPKPENNRVGEIVNFDQKTYCAEIEREAYGYIEYEYTLGDKAKEYELVPKITLENLDTEFVRRRALEYGKDGNKVVKHWHEVQHVADSLYKSKEWEDEYGVVHFNLFVFFPEYPDGVLVGKHYTNPEWYGKVEILDRLKKAGYASMHDFIEATKGAMSAGRFVGGVDIAFIRQADPSFADECAAYRLGRLKMQEQKWEQEHQEDLERERRKEAEKQQAIEAERAKYFGWADTLTAMQYGRAKKLMDGLIRYDNSVMTVREYIITLVKEGRTLYKREYQTSWKSDKSTMVYGLSIPGKNLFTQLKKTEYDFAEYLINHKEVLDS